MGRGWLGRARGAARAHGASALVCAAFGFFAATELRQVPASALASLASEQPWKDARAGAGRSGEPGAYLLWVFQRADCSSYRDVFPLLEELHTAGTVQVVGALVGPSVSRGGGGRARTPELDIRFPVRLDLEKRARAIVRALGYEETPIGILFDRAGSVRLVLRPHPPGRGTRERHRQAITQLTEYARLHLHEGGGT